MITEAHYRRISPACRGALIRYVLHGDQVGDFLSAVISNELVEAAGRADAENIVILHVYAAFLHNVAPGASWGSREAMRSWRGIGEFSDPLSLRWPEEWVGEVRLEWLSRVSSRHPSEEEPDRFGVPDSLDS